MYSDDIKNKAEEIFKLRGDPIAFVDALEKPSPAVILCVMARLATWRELDREVAGRRDACSAAIHMKLNAELINSNEKLDKAAGYLAKVGFILSVIIGIAGILIPLYDKYFGSKL